MSDIQNVQLGFINLAIKLKIVDQAGVVVDVSEATSKTITLKKPDTTQTETIYTAVNVTDGTDGWVQYITMSGDLDTIGIWEAQANFIHPSFEGGAVVEKFKVVRNISCPT